MRLCISTGIIAVETLILEKINVPRVAEVTLIAKQILKKYPTNNDFAKSGHGRIYDAKCIESNNEIILSDWWFEK